jgi:hypothetical protein
MIGTACTASFCVTTTASVERIDENLLSFDARRDQQRYEPQPAKRGLNLTDAGMVRWRKAPAPAFVPGRSGSSRAAGARDVLEAEKAVHTLLSSFG